MGPVVAIRNYQQDEYSGTSTGFIKETSSAVKARLSYDDSESELDKTIPTEALYPLSDTLSPLISTAFRLLDETIKKTTEAYDSLKNDNWVASDDALLHVMAILPELFCCKGIGDGFGATINAIFYGMKNHAKKERYTPDQINMVRICLKRLQTEPFIEFADCIDIIMKLEDSGFTVEPQYLDHFMDLIDA